MLHSRVLVPGTMTGEVIDLMSRYALRLSNIMCTFWEGATAFSVGKVYFGRSTDLYGGSAVADERETVKTYFGRKGSDICAKQSKRA